MADEDVIVRVWREANGVEADSDFAFFWDDYAMAEWEVRPIIPKLWAAARERVQHGLGGAVKDLPQEASHAALAPALAKARPERPRSPLQPP